MIGKTNWTKHIHGIRRREIDIVFSMLPRAYFSSGLEIGAGDGFQTTLLAPRMETLVSSDLNYGRIKESLKIPGVTYAEIDADSMGGDFGVGAFDFIFSSNVLEHLENPKRFLEDTCSMLTEDGYAVHIVPSRHIKIFYLLFYYPNLFLLALDRIFGKLKGKPFFRGEGINLENNINAKTYPSRKESKIKKFLFPKPHGNFPGHIQEFIAFGKSSWEQLFISSGYTVFSYAKGPAFSGYGFGFEFLRKLSEYCGVSSEHVFVLKKMTSFERTAREYTDSFLSRGSMYEKEKFVGDWMNKEKNARAFLADFKKVVGEPKEKNILDVGFGNGIMLSEFARAGSNAYGLETEEALLSFARSRFDKDNLRAKLVIYDGKSFPFPDNFFDFAYSTSVLEHMSHPQEVLKEVSRTLVPGGRFYLSFPNKYAPRESHTGLWFISWLPRSLAQGILKLSKSSPLEDWNLHFISYFSLKKMAENAGLRIVYNAESTSSLKRFIKRALARAGVHYGVLLKTIILVLEKPHESKL